MMKKLVTCILVLFIILLGILVGCSRQIQKTEDGTTKMEISISNINSLVENIISDKYVNEIRYTRKDIEQILNLAKSYKIYNPYIPVKGVSTDYIIEVREEQDALAIVYPHFTVRQSIKELIPISKIQEKQDVKLNIGNGTLINIREGQKILLLKLNDVYISISSSKFFDEKDFEKVAESLVQIID